jgi:glycosyltransferase involved in cell wall biosynthesis
MSPLLSIVVPHHNHVHCLPRLLDSICAQSFKDLEVVLVDDYSDESCAPLVKSYKNKGLNITLLEHGERIYTMKARLKGIKAAGGDIIGFADADDMLWGTEALEQNVRLFLQKQADVLHFRSVITDSDGIFVAYAPLADPFAPLLEGNAILAGYAAANIYGASSLWNKFFSRRLCLLAEGEALDSPFTRRREDYWLCLLLLPLAKRYVGSDFTGYAHAWKEKRTTNDPERVIAQYRLLCTAPSMLREKNCPEMVIERIQRNLTKVLLGDAGHFSRTVLQLPDHEREAAMAHVLDHPDSQYLMQALLLTNSLNATKLIDIHNIYR